MKKIFIIAAFWCGLMACQDDSIGFLITEYAGYSQDSMIVRKRLDETPPQPNPEYESLIATGWYTAETLIMMGIYPTIGGEDYKRLVGDIPWSSLAIEGVEGTQPIIVSIKSVRAVSGDADKLRACLSVRGNGIFSVPVRNDVPVGRYVISLNFRNEGWSKDIDDCFTIIVTE